MLQQRTITILPGRNGQPITASIQEQLIQCLQSIEQALTSCQLEPNDILKQTVFLNAAGNDEFYSLKKELTTGLKTFYKSAYPPTGFVGEPPAGGGVIAFELTVLAEKDERVVISRKDLDNTRYIVAQSPDLKMIFAAGITPGDENGELLDQSIDAFRLMKRILKAEKMDFSHVVRQWNFIENITAESPFKGGLRQNYQVFNDIRSMFYGEATFENGYPAATGIGMDCGCLALEFIAANSTHTSRKKDPANKEVSVIPIQNPAQVDAHRYTQDVLEGRAGQGFEHKCTPKFERAKAVFSDNPQHESIYVYISGTAAIQGEKTVATTDPQKQTRVTINNIAHLVSPENLLKHNVPISPPSASYQYVRVYVKHKADVPAVKTVCENYFKDVPALYLIADICRQNLLVEIEGAVDYKKQ